MKRKITLYWKKNLEEDKINKQADIGHISIQVHKGQLHLNMC